MGVKELWGILAPAKREVPLESLKGQTIAVDLSVWICENNNVKAFQGRVLKPHLRNLFFRVSNLQKLGVKLVFVIDGDAPELKWETIQTRIQARFPGRGRGHRGGGNPRQKSSSRSHFKSLIKECQEMLDMLGVPYVQAQGEAEAMCALLNEQGIVDACITEDGDVFLYGARWVYKNFNLSSKDPVIASYKMADIEALGFDRETLVGLGLLLGCDFIPKGVPGVGKVHAVGLVHHLGGTGILARFKDWARGMVSFEKSLPSRPSHCSRCHHVGTAQAHKSGGCAQCGGARTCGTTKNPTPCSCVWHLAKEEYDKSSLERDIMMKALQLPGFPPQQVIDEFLVTKDRCPKGALQSTRPHMVPIMKFAFKKLEWPEVYTRSKVIDLVTLFDLEATGDRKTKTRDPLLIDHILKKRTRAGVSCLEVAWVLPDSWRLEEDDSDIICTIERLDLLKSAHPAAVTDFETTELGKKSRKKGQQGKRSAKLPEEGTTSTNDDLADQGLSASTDIESIAGQLSRLELQNDHSAEKSLASRAEGDVIEILDNSPGSCNPGRTAPADLNGGDYRPASTIDAEGHSYLPSLRERLRTKSRAKESEKCRKSRCKGSETAVGMTSSTDVSLAPVTADHPNRAIRMRTDRERVVGRSSLRERKQLNSRNVDNIRDNKMVGNSFCDISTQRYRSMDKVYPTSATSNKNAATNDIPEWSCISDDDISVVSGHINRAEVGYERARPFFRSRGPDLGHDTARDICGPSRDPPDGPGSETFHMTIPALPEVNTLNICEVTEGDISGHLSQVTSRTLSQAPSREPDDFGKSSSHSDCSRSVMCHTTFPAPHEVDTPDITLSDETLEDGRSEQKRMNHVNILPTTKEGLSPPTEKDATHSPEDPSKVIQETAVSDKLLTVSSLRQRLLLRQTEVLSSRGGDGVGISSPRGSDTLEPTLLDLDTPFQTPSQTPLQTPTQTPSQTPTQTQGTSVGKRAMEDTVHCQTPSSADAPTASNQPVCESPASFLTAMATPSSIGTSSGLCGEPDNSSLGSFATPGSTVGLERSRDHSMFGELNFSLQTSLWSPWDANSDEDSQKFSGREHPSVNDLSSMRAVTKQEEGVSGKLSMASGLMSKKSVSVSKNGAVMKTPNAMYTGVKDRDQVSADERFITPGGNSTTSPEGHADVFESPRGSPMASLENLNKVLDMDAAQSDCGKQISMQRFNIEKDGSSGERASLPRKWEQAKKGDLSRNVLEEDGNVRLSAKDREDVVWEKRGLLGLSSQIERLGLGEHVMDHSTGNARLSKDTKGMNIHHRGEGAFSLGDKENSPVSLMDRLRMKNTRHRDILKSMELDK